MYHRIAEREVDPWALAVTPQHFAEHLAVLQDLAHTIKLTEMAAALNANEIAHKSAAITFDDGYANNLWQAKPILERYAMPATVFVTSGYLGKGREFWWDALDHLLLQPGELPAELTLTLAGQRCCWQLGAASKYSETAQQQDRTIYASEAKAGTRLAFYCSIWRTLQPLPAAEQDRSLAEIAAWAGVTPQVRASHRIMDQAELAQLEGSGLVEIGAHTVSHPFLPAHQAEMQGKEITESKRQLEELLGHPVATFSYPFGAYRGVTIAHAKRAGYECACSTVEETVWRGSERFLLPRFEVWDWDGEEFERRLWRWLRV
jgi:peptidoglycan/xylan/chitin deacetylase (PgdA/CDA1 family)